MLNVLAMTSFLFYPQKVYKCRAQELLSIRSICVGISMQSELIYFHMLLLMVHIYVLTCLEKSADTGVTLKMYEHAHMYRQTWDIVFHRYDHAYVRGLQSGV